jgi:hypothetical protein
MSEEFRTCLREMMSSDSVISHEAMRKATKHFKGQKVDIP